MSVPLDSGRQGCRRRTQQDSRHLIIILNYAARNFEAYGLREDAPAAADPQLSWPVIRRAPRPNVTYAQSQPIITAIRLRKPTRK